MNILKRLFPYLKTHFPALFAGFVFMIIQNFGYSKIPEYIQRILDEVTGNNSYSAVLNYTLIVLFYIVIVGVALFLMRKLIISVSRKIEFKLREDLYAKLLEVDFGFYQQHETGDLMSRCTNDLNDVRTLLGPGIMYVPNSLTRLLLFIPVLTVLNSKLMIYVGCALIFLFLFIVIVMPRMRPYFKKVQEQIGKINSRAWQIVSGINIIKQNTLEDIETERFANLNKEYLKRQMSLVRFRGMLRPFFFFLFSVIEFILLLVGGKEVIDGTMTLGELLQFNTMVGILVFPVLSLGWVMSLMQQGISALNRIYTIFDYKVEKRDDWKSIESDHLDFSVKNLLYTYPSSDVPALSGINVDVRQGMVLGITGSVGSGKSTLISILSGTLKPERGMVFINGIDIRDINPENLYNAVSVVPQETFLFSATAAENIGLGKDAEYNKKAVETAAETAALDGDITGFANSYSQMIGERGITLSGGQKQRMSIARAFYKDSSVIIFDDSLSSVDSKTSAAIFKNIKGLGKEKTVIIISHRVDVIKECDEIIVFSKGSISERGTHEHLIQQEGRYARIWELQNLREQMSL